MDQKQKYQLWKKPQFFKMHKLTLVRNDDNILTKQCCYHYQIHFVQVKEAGS